MHCSALICSDLYKQVFVGLNTVKARDEKLVDNSKSSFKIKYLSDTFLLFGMKYCYMH